MGTDVTVPLKGPVLLVSKRREGEVVDRIAVPL
jgi:hypothetical protein